MKLPSDIAGTETVKALRRLGFISDHQTGSHHIMRGPDGRIVVVPMHRIIKRGTLRGLIRQAGVTVEALLRRFEDLISDVLPWCMRKGRASAQRGGYNLD